MPSFDGDSASMVTRRLAFTARNDNSNAAGNNQETPGSPLAEAEPALQTQERCGEIPDSLPTEAPPHSLISFEPHDASIKACHLAK